MSIRTVIAILILIGAFVAIRYDKNEVVAPTPVACTQEAKECPDGSFVSRSGPECQFAECPKVTIPTVSTGTVTGRVTIYPVCPVEFDPPRPECAPRGYETSVTFKRSDGTSATAQTDANGYYSIKLKTGVYVATPKGGNTLPSCESESVTIQKNQTLTKSFSCDSGIR